MKEIPILFKGPMVRAIQEKRKSMTRRLRGLDHINENPDIWKFVGTNLTDRLKFPVSTRFNKENAIWYLWKRIDGKYGYLSCQCPYGRPDDVLWVRETWSPLQLEEGLSYRYKATFIENTGLKPKWKPSIHMPKKACRMFLLVVDIRIERLQDISEMDARNEGAYDPNCGIHGITQYKTGFQELWISINGKNSWDKNPWVWVIKF